MTEPGAGQPLKEGAAGGANLGYSPAASITSGTSRAPADRSGRRSPEQAAQKCELRAQAGGLVDVRHRRPGPRTRRASWSEREARPASRANPTSTATARACSSASGPPRDAARRPSKRRGRWRRSTCSTTRRSDYIRAGIYEDVLVGDLVDRLGGCLRSAPMRRILRTTAHY